jgi:NitT/TauT family transport system ATP-binding protein
LPYDNPEKTFETMIAWRRSAGLMDHNANTGMVFVPKEDEPIEDTPA